MWAKDFGVHFSKEDKCTGKDASEKNKGNINSLPLGWSLLF